MKLLSLLILMLLGFTGYVHAQVSYNLDIESINQQTGLPMGWGLGNVRNSDIPNDKTLAAYTADTTVKQNGRYSLCTSWSADYEESWTASNYVIKQTFKGKKITLTGYAKTEQVTGGAGLWMRIDGNGKMLAFDNMQSRAIKGTTDWQQYSIELDYNQEEAKRIVVGGLIIGTGKLWIDNLQIKIDGKDIKDASLFEVTLSKPELDSAFNEHSGINSINLNDEKIKTLTNLGMLWGFIKYYHAYVNNGEYNMDAELFRVLPKVLAAPTVGEANVVMEQWVDRFGKPGLCKKCDDFKKNKDTKLSPDYGSLFDKNNLPKTLIEKLNYIKANRSTKSTHYYIGMATGIGNPEFKHENGYSINTYPDAGIRLLALYRYWNMIQYFFPDRHLIGEDWNKVLPEFIPEFCTATDALAYQLACLKIIARIHDTHAGLWGGAAAIQKMKGEYFAPFQASFIEDKLVVTGYYKDSMAVKNIVKPGDIIEKIGNSTVAELVAKYLPLTPASNYETQQRDMVSIQGFLLRSTNKSVQMTINRDGKIAEITIEQMPLAKLTKADMGEKADAGYKIIDDNIGYLYPAKLEDDDLAKIKDQFENTKGLIIDMRCYPSTFMTFSYANWLKPEPTAFVRFTGGSIDFPGSFDIYEGPRNGTRNKKNYKGKLVIIVNANTQSSAEYQTMALCTTPGCKVIGSTTSGADGNVSEIVLPGGIRTMISGIGVLYPDGTESQRKGVKIDKVVRPTIKGIKEGRDEQLEEAIKIIKG